MGRQISGFGICTLQYSEMLAWSKLRGVEIDLFELNAIKMIDLAYIDHQSKSTSKEIGKIDNGGHSTTGDQGNNKRGKTSQS